MRSLMLLLFLATSLAPAWGVTNVWFAPGGRGKGTSREDPFPYYPNLIKWGLLGGDKRNDREVIMHFLPGEYLIQPINTEDVHPSEWRITIRGEGARPEDTVLKLVPNYTGGADSGGGNWVSVIDLGRDNEYIRRFVLENITIDGNWEGQINYNSRRYMRSYKSCPIWASARTGRIRNVIVRNYGAHGVLPQRTNDVGAGIEIFPLSVFTREEGQEPEDGDAAPWVVENCEATGFNTLFSGYVTTLLGVVALDPAKIASRPDPNRRVIWFRGNQVRGNPDAIGVIAMGTAASPPTKISGRITWSDSVILNATGFNTDTGAMRWLDFTNLLLLDAVSVGGLGVPQAGKSHHDSYNISGNSVRLTGYIASRSYRDFRVDSAFRARQDNQLAMGRPAPSFANGLVIRGVADDIRLTENWFTTRPADQFNRYESGGSRPAEFTLVRRLPDLDPETPEAPKIARHPATEVDLSGNSVSSVPFDFERMQPLGGRKLSRLTEGSSPLLDKRTVRSAQLAFAPTGTVNRVALLFTNSVERVANQRPSVGRLLGAFEIVCGTPSGGSSGKFTVPVRLAIQPTPRSGFPGTSVVPGRRVFLEVLPGSLHPQKLSAETDRNGVANFAYDVKAGAKGMDFFRAWMDFGQGSSETWDEYQDAWSTAHYGHGTTVGLVVDSDVADARSGSPGRVRLIRTGSDDQALKVQLSFATGTGMAEFNKDFRLVASSGGRNPSGRADDAASVGPTVDLPRGQRQLDLRVEPLKGARHAALITMQIKPGADYAAGYPASGELVIFSPAQ